VTGAETFKYRQATLADLDALVDLHFTSFTAREHMAIYLGRDFIRSMYRWFVDSPRTVTIVAEDQGGIVGLITGCNGPYFSLMFTENRAATLKAIMLRPWVICYPAIISRLLSAFFTKNHRLQELSDDKSFMNFCLIAIYPEYRQKGLGVALIKGLVKEGRKRGWHKFYLITYKRNKLVTLTLKSSGGWRQEPLGKNKLLWINDLIPPKARDLP
jgi:GNAT superfamily N-acetyltransferase